ncbi:MAG: type II toxin-antitoxin system Phd/YefM family antitoxin [Propionibacteriaceae bacterium]|nr:type II toxin-antitoxin system Phd/YefM family antitoxin [Propionibacteriaceae bacterium]
MSMITVTEARKSLPRLVDQVQSGQEVTLTRHGQPVAVLIHPDSLARRRTSAIWGEVDRIEQALEQARTAPVEAGLSGERAEELVDGIRAERDER